MALNSSTYSHPNSQYSFASPRQQNFSLPNDTILYILNNCESPKVFQNLLKVCKHIFAKKKVNVVDALTYFYYDEIEDRKLFYYKQNINDQIKIYLSEDEAIKCWLIKSLTLDFIERQQPSYSSIFYKCNLKSLTIFWQTLSFEELSFLLNGKNIEELNLSLVKIKYFDGSPVHIDVILSQCPKVINVEYGNVLDQFSLETMEKLNSHKFNNKLEKFTYGIFEFENGIYEQARQLLCDFVFKNVKPKKDSACFHVKLYEKVHNYRDEFESFFEENLKEWELNVNNCKSIRFSILQGAGFENYKYHTRFGKNSARFQPW